MNALLNPAIFRFTVRTPESRYGAIKEAARKYQIPEGRLVQALFDRLDLEFSSVDIANAVQHHRAIWPLNETTKELHDRATSLGLTVKELKVFRALREYADMTGRVVTDPENIGIKAMVPISEHDTIYDRLLTLGYIAVAPGPYGHRVFNIARIPE